MVPPAIHWTRRVFGGFSFEQKGNFFAKLTPLLDISHDLWTWLLNQIHIENSADSQKQYKSSGFCGGKDVEKMG